VLKLTSAQVLQDGLAVRLKFEGGLAVGQPALNRLADCGEWSWRPGLDDGALVAVNGQAAEVVGLQAEDWNMALPWIDEPETGGSIPAGQYVFLLAVADQVGNEIRTSPPIFGYSNETGTTIPDGGKVRLHWRGIIPRGYSLRIYAATQSPVASNFRLVANVPAAQLDSPTSYTLATLGISDATWKPSSVAVTITCLVSTPVPPLVPVRITATRGLVCDDTGIQTEAAINRKAENLSLVNGTGFLATGAMTFARSVYLSSSHGSDETGTGSMDQPFRTMARASKEVGSDQANVRFAFLRGDIFSYEPWTVAHWGTGPLTPCLHESYWNPAYGPDPGRRPVLMDSPEPKPSSPWFQQGDSRTGRARHGDWPYQYFRGLAFVRNANLAVSGPAWPAAMANDWVIVSDCTFENVFLSGSYGVPQFIAPVGCMVHRCVVQNARGGAEPDDPHVQGLFVAHCGNWLFSQSAFIHNGWRGDDASQNDQFNHNVYLSAMCRDAVIHSSWFIDGCLSGLQMRGGGVAAYNVFKDNPSHLSSNDGHTFYRNAFQGVGLYSHIASGTHSFGPVAIHDSNITFGVTSIDQTRTVVNTSDGLYAVHHDSTGPYVYSAIAFMHETAINAGAISIGNQLPSRRLRVTHNLVVNDPTKATDKNGEGLRSAVLKPVRVEQSPRTTWDRNAYVVSSSRSAFEWQGKTYAFPAWRMLGETNSVAVDTVQVGVIPERYIDQCVAVLRARPAGAWSSLSDGRSCFANIAYSLTPTNLSPAQDGSYYGAADYRQ
jgi:hypothetical protein